MEQLEEWLKTTVIGIILLGALGSIIAYLILKLFSLVFRDVLPAPYRLGYELGYQHGGTQHQIIQEKRYIELLVYLAHQSLTWLSSLIGGCTFFLLAYLEFTRTGIPLFSREGFIFVVIGFNLIGYGLASFLGIRGLYKIVIVPILESNLPPLAPEKE